jgi:hypothetical protein
VLVGLERNRRPKVMRGHARHVMRRTEMFDEERAPCVGRFRYVDSLADDCCRQCDYVVSSMVKIPRHSSTATNIIKSIIRRR